MSRGRRSEVRTSWAPAWCSALKVWKNSCSVLALLCEELDVVDEQHVDAAVGGLEGLDAAAVERADEVVGERLGGRVAGGQAAAVLGDVVGDRVQQVRLAEPGRAADEERVVGQAGHLGDGERGGVGEPVAVADDELVEGQARVELLRGPRPWRLRRGRAPAAASSGPAIRTARPGPSTVSAQARSSRPKRVCDPARGRRRARRATSVVPSSSRRPIALEPDVPRRLGDGLAQLTRGSGARWWLDQALTRGARRDLLGGAEARGGLGRRAANGPEREHSKASGSRRRVSGGGFANRARMSVHEACSCTACAQACARARRVSFYAAAQRGGSVLRRAREPSRPAAKESTNVKRTYQPKKRKRARTHGFRAPHEHPRRSHRPQAAPRQGPQAADRQRHSPSARCAPPPPPAVAQRGVRARLSAGPLEGQPVPRAVRVPARGGGCRADDGPRLGLSVSAPRRRRRRSQPRQARAARGVLAGGRAAARRLGLRRRRAPGRARPRRARGHRRHPHRAGRARRRSRGRAAREDAWP